MRIHGLTEEKNKKIENNSTKAIHFSLPSKIPNIHTYIYISSSLVRSKILADPDDEKRNHSPTFQPFQEPPKPSPSPSPSLSSPSLSFIGEISERSASKSRRGPISEDGDVGCRNDEGKVHRPIRCTSGREAWRIGIGGADGSMGSRSPNRVGGFQ